MPPRVEYSYLLLGINGALPFIAFNCQNKYKWPFPHLCIASFVHRFLIVGVVVGLPVLQFVLEVVGEGELGVAAGRPSAVAGFHAALFCGDRASIGGPGDRAGLAAAQLCVRTPHHAAVLALAAVQLCAVAAVAAAAAVVVVVVVVVAAAVGAAVMLIRYGRGARGGVGHGATSGRYRRHICR